MYIKTTWFQDNEPEEYILWPWFAAVSSAQPIAFSPQYKRWATNSRFEGAFNPLPKSIRKSFRRLIRIPKAAALGKTSFTNFTKDLSHLQKAVKEIEKLVSANLSNNSTDKNRIDDDSTTDISSQSSSDSEECSSVSSNVPTGTDVKTGDHLLNLDSQNTTVIYSDPEWAMRLGPSMANTMAAYIIADAETDLGADSSTSTSSGCATSFIAKVVELASKRVNLLYRLWPEIEVRVSLAAALREKLENLKNQENKFLSDPFYKNKREQIEKLSPVRKELVLLDEVQPRERMAVVDSLSKSFFETGRVNDNITFEPYEKDFGFYEALMKTPLSVDNVSDLVKRGQDLVEKWRNLWSADDLVRPMAVKVAPHLAMLYNWGLILHVCWNSLVSFRNAVVNNDWNNIYRLRDMAASAGLDKDDITRIAKTIMSTQSLVQAFQAKKSFYDSIPVVQIQSRKVQGLGSEAVLQELDRDTHFFDKMGVPAA